MLVKIKNLIINTDDISLAEYAPGPPDMQEHRLIIHFKGDDVTTSRAFKEEAADVLWELLCAEAHDALAP